MNNWRQILSWESKPQGAFWNFDAMSDVGVIKEWKAYSEIVSTEDYLGIVDAYNLKMLTVLETEMHTRGIKPDDERLQ